MTPDQIKAGHTYEMKSGSCWTVKAFVGNGNSIIITDGRVSMYDIPSGFAAYAVRDITPAPESDQGEKVAQAQSQGASRGRGGRTPLADLSTIAANLITCQGLPDPDEPYRPLGKRWMREHRQRSVRMGNAIAAAVAQLRRAQKAATPPVAAVNAELLGACKVFVEGYDYDRKDMIGDAFDKAVAAIARAEAGTPSHPRFRHRRTGDTYDLLIITNEHAERTAQYPPTAVYRRVSDQTVWSRPVQDWGKDFEEVTGNE